MALGKNLENILGDYFGDQGIDLNSTSTQVIELDISKIARNPHQTRKHFEASKITALAQNIDKNGLINPITVLKDQSGEYILLAGERRLRAYKELEKKKIPAIVRDIKKLSEEDRFLISASENIQRENLNPIELAKTYKILMENHKWSARALALSIGVSPQYVLNYLNLLTLHNEVQEAIGKGLIGEAHARRLSPLPPEKQVEFLKKILKEGISIRQLSDMIADELKSGNIKQSTRAAWVNQLPTKQYSALESWAASLPKSRIKAKGDEKKGKIIITWGGYIED